ncbi:MAG: hypothetical protein SPH08_07215 [Sodaliphilus sp.]|nr:hypothetical protein [Sodaliphilus sp.]
MNGIKNKKHKKQPWGNVECFAFGGATDLAGEGGVRGAVWLIQATA